MGRATYAAFRAARPLHGFPAIPSTPQGKAGPCGRRPRRCMAGPTSIAANRSGARHSAALASSVDDLRRPGAPVCRPKPRIRNLMTEQKSYRLEEATIEQLHQAIRAGQTTVTKVVQQYID